MIFLLDTTTNPTAIGLYDGKRLTTKTIESNPENNRKLIEIIKKFIGKESGVTHVSVSKKNNRRTSVNPGKITAIGVINGPGTFTGVRTGVTIANAIGYALKVPIYAIDTLTAQLSVGADNYLPKKRAQNFVPLQDINNVISLLSASNSEVFFARFSKGKINGQIEVVNVENNLKNRLRKGDLIVGDIKCEQISNLSMYQFNNVTSDQRIKNLLDLILEKRIKPSKQALPLYIKKPNITTKKKKQSSQTIK